LAQENINLKLAPAPMSIRDSAQLVTSADLRPRLRPRHALGFFGFVLLVLLPVGLAAAYLFAIATDQYHSQAGFSVRSEEFRNPLDALSAFTDVSGSSSTASDSEIIYDFIQSQALIRLLDRDLDLRTLFAARPTGFGLVPVDLLFGLAPDASIEDIEDYWSRMISVSRESGTGIINMKVTAFTPEDAQRLAQAIVEASSTLVNDLSRIAQNDAIQFAQADVALAEARLAEMRRRVRAFRAANQIIDPETDASSQSSVLAELHSTLAKTLIRRGNLEIYTDKADSRLNDLDRQISVIRDQIERERAVIANHKTGGASLSDVIGQYEELLVDLEFSENAYVAARGAVEQARAEARRQSRYAAVHIQPTLAEESLYPRRWLLLGVILVAALSIWAILSLIYYNIRDRA
jgi:capsular polysaccharide transport system permease protein